MISPSENKGAENYLLPGMPVRSLNGELARKNVSRLEFHVMEQSRAESMQDTATGSTLAEPDTRLKEEMVALEEQFNLQAKQIATQLEMAKDEARTESREEWKEELEERIVIERAGGMMRACEEFGKERTRYFAGVEAEVVKLALAIAARVLHREVKLDPLLLTSAVRVALEKVTDNSATILRVPAAEVESWRKAFANSEVELIGDEQLGVGECLFETNVGRVDLGVRAQLEEIEKGFFDLLQQRPS